MAAPTQWRQSSQRWWWCQWAVCSGRRSKWLCCTAMPAATRSRRVPHCWQSFASAWLPALPLASLPTGQVKDPLSGYAQVPWNPVPPAPCYRCIVTTSTPALATCVPAPSPPGSSWLLCTQLPARCCQTLSAAWPAPSRPWHCCDSAGPRSRWAKASCSSSAAQHA